MEKKYKVVVTYGECGVYWTEVVRVTDNYDVACDVAYEVGGCVEEVEREGGSLNDY